MIRTTVSLEDNLYKEARKKAIDERVAFTKLLNNALSKYLGKTFKKEKNLTGTEFLSKLVKLGKKYNLKGPKDVARNHDKYLWR